MLYLLSNTNFLKLFLAIIAVTVVLVEPMEIITQERQSQPFILIERIKPSPRQALQVPCNSNRTGLYVMWQKLLVRVTAQLQQTVLAKSFGVMKVPTGQEMTPYSVEQAQFRNIAVEVEMEKKRIINAVLTLMEILLALDIIILLAVFVMLLSCCFKSKQPTDKGSTPPEVVKA